MRMDSVNSLNIRVASRHSADYAEARWKRALADGTRSGDGSIPSEKARAGENRAAFDQGSSLIMLPDRPNAPLAAGRASGQEWGGPIEFISELNRQILPGFSGWIEKSLHFSKY